MCVPAVLVFADTCMCMPDSTAGRVCLSGVHRLGVPHTSSVATARALVRSVSAHVMCRCYTWCNASARACMSASDSCPSAHRGCFAGTAVSRCDRRRGPGCRAGYASRAVDRRRHPIPRQRRRQCRTEWRPCKHGGRIERRRGRGRPHQRHLHHGALLRAAARGRPDGPPGRRDA